VSASPPGPTADPGSPGGRIAALDGGASYHFFALADPAVAPVLDAVIDLRGLRPGDLDGFDTVVVPCRANPALLADKAAILEAVPARGGTLVVMGETAPDRWLPDIVLEPVPTNFWWWLEEGTDLGVTIAAPDHPLAAHLDRAAATWHVHGVLTPPAEAVSVIDWAGRGSLLYDHRGYRGGRLVITTLDPLYHMGSFFMPATRRFAAGFFRWLAGADPR
jgi:hypothetical protein